MQNLTRNKSINFRVTDDEYVRIKDMQKRTRISNMRAYLLKMALNGQIWTLDFTTVNECDRLLRNISNNINQIAKRVNSTGNIYADDIAEIKSRQAEIWEQQEVIIKTLTDVLEVL